MSAIVVLQWYLGVQVAVAIAALATHTLARLRLPPAVSLRWARVLVPLALLAPAVALWLPGRAPYQPPVQVWSSLDEPAAVAVTVAGFPTRTEATAVLRPDGVAYTTAAATGGLLALLLLARAVAAGWALHRSLHRTVLWRRVGRVEIRVGWDATAPYAVRLPGRALVVLDEATFLDERDRRVAVAHELQHHRQGDTAFAWVAAGLRVLCLPNPAAGLLSRRLAELEELAVDGALLARRVVPAREYGQLLLRTAERALRPVEVPCAAGLTPARSPSLLKRRVEMLHRRPRTYRAAAIAVVVLAGALLTTAAWAAEKLVQDRRVPEAKVVEVAARVTGGAFPVPSNDVVIECVDRYAGTAWGRRFLRDGLVQMETHEALVHDALDRHGLPRELAAVPLIESGYRNLGSVRGESDAPGSGGAGIWMFIPATARRYDLVVDATRDDRLDEVLETDAAMRLLSDLYDEFGEWPLALAGYNQGARHVRQAIEDEGTDDAWELIRRGALNRYAGFVTAAVIVLEEPSLVDAER